MYLIQVLLPVNSKGSDERISQTREELVELYEGVTAYVRSPARGAWIAPDGEEEQDDVIMVEVLVDALDRDWWRQYRQQLAARFGQEQIHIRFIPAEIP
jgi:hypothetical protein